MLSIFRKKTSPDNSNDKLVQIKRFDVNKEYLNLLQELILDAQIDSDNWGISSFLTSIGGSIELSKGKSLTPVVGRRKDEVEIRIEFHFTNDDFKCDKIELKIEGNPRLTIEDCNSKISSSTLKIIYDFYCKRQIEENDKISKHFNNDRKVIDNIISKSTKRDDKLNKLGI